MPRPEVPDDQLIDEGFRGHRAYVLIDSQHHQAVDAESLERGELLAPAGKARRRTIRIDELLELGSNTSTVAAVPNSAARRFTAPIIC